MIFNHLATLARLGYFKDGSSDNLAKLSPHFAGALVAIGRDLGEISIKLPATKELIILSESGAYQGKGDRLGTWAFWKLMDPSGNTGDVLIVRRLKIFFFF